MDSFLQRTEMLIGSEAIKNLKDSKVAVFGIGGVGSFCVEALARAGVGHLFLIDSDVIQVSNINRQIHATFKTVGKPKAKVMAERVLDINPDAKVETIIDFYTPEKRDDFFKDEYDYVVDAIDTVSSKIDLILFCKEKNIPIISSMGAGNKLNPVMFEVSDIYKTSVCPLAKIIRGQLRKRGVSDLKVVYSKEKPIDIDCDSKEKDVNGKCIIGSISTVPPAAGLIIAGEVIKDLIKK